MVERLALRLRQAADTAPSNRRLNLIAKAVAAHAALAASDTGTAIRLFEALEANARRDSLSFDHFEPLAVERMTLAELLLATRQFRRALIVATVFDHPEPVSFLAFLPRSLRIREEAADSLGEQQLAAQYRARLTRLNRATVPGR